MSIEASLLARLLRDEWVAREAARFAAAAAQRSGGRRHRISSRGTLGIRRLLGKSVTDKDVESDDAIWALYERWCEAYNKERDHAEMARRFKVFKDSVEGVHENNVVDDLVYLGRFCDGIDEQQMLQLKNEAIRREPMMRCMAGCWRA
uniref:Cathepsin propeptide inhibitor domain-containing protein n=1 Tax=Leersia perrieri TaxID=77586 RepID=A0A0D9VZQ4_9ORYZ